MSIPQIEFGFEESIIKSWQLKVLTLDKALTKYYGEKNKQKIYRVCLQGIIDAVISDDPSIVNIFIRKLVEIQRGSNTKENQLIPELIFSLRKMKPMIEQKFDIDLGLKIQENVDLFILAYVQNLHHKLKYQKNTIKCKNQELKRRARELAVLGYSSSYVNSSLEFQQVLEAILTQLAKIMGTETCAIFGIDEGKKELRVLAQQGLSPEYSRKICIPIGQGVAGKAVEILQPVVLSNVKKEWVISDAPDFIVPLLHDINYAAVLAVPLKHKGKCLGSIGVYHKNPYRFSDEEKSILSIFANNAALAIENARLHLKAKELAVIEERNRIARDLHDSVCQSLFSMVLNVEACTYLMENDKEKAIETMNTIRQIAEDASAEMRSLVFELRPTAIEQQGLLSALQNFINITNKRNNLQITLSCNSIPPLTNEMEMCIYRVIHEAVSNAVKHASANEISVLLDVGTEEISFSIIDDGKGFDVNFALNQGNTFGMVTMRERIEAFNGNLTVASKLGQGTRIQARIPFKGGR